MATDPVGAAQAFLAFYIHGDATGFHPPNQTGPASAGSLLLADGTTVAAPKLPGISRRQPAIQGEPSEFESLPRDPGPNPQEDPTVAVVDMCGLEDFLFLPGQDPIDGSSITSLVLFWCTDYPPSALSDLGIQFPPSVTTVSIPSTVEADSVALELTEKLEYLLGDDFDGLNLQVQIEYVSFGQLSSRKNQLDPAASASPSP